MKSYKTLLLTAAFGLMFAACGDDSSSSAPVDEPASSSSVKESDAKSSSSAKAKSSSSEEKSEDKSSSSEEKTSEKYVLSFLMENSQFFGPASLSDDQEKVIEDFAEESVSGSIAYLDGSVYILASDDAMNSTLSRYELDEDGNMPEKPTATAKYQGTRAIMMKVVDENKLYVEQSMGDAITAVDPKTLKTTATIDLSKYVDTESGAMSTVPGSAVIRDGKMFVALNQFVDFTNMVAGPRASVVVIDVETDKVEKAIYDDRVAVLGGMDDMNNTMFFVDEKGDIYMYSNASYCFVEGYQEGWVRIKKGETEFDTSWVFRMHDAAYDGKESNNNNLMVGGTYMGNGKFMGFFGNFADPSNFNNYEWQFVVVDIYKKTIEKIDLDPTIPWFAPAIHMSDDGKSVLLGHADKKSGAIYRYDIESGKVSKEMDVTTGTSYFIVPIAD